MQPSELTVEVLDVTLARRALVLPQYWNDIKTKSNLRAVGEWEMTLPCELPAAQLLAQPGSGILITGPTGELFSGPMTDAKRTASQADPGGSFAYTGVDYSVILADADAYPTPATADVTAQTSDYDVRTGAAETVVRALVGANIGPSAPSARRAGFAQRLTLAVDGGTGGTVTASSRFDSLLAQAAALTRVGGIAFRIVRTAAAGLQLQFFTPADKSRRIRLDIANGRLSSYEHTVSAPTVTRVIVGGQGEGTARTFLERSSSDSLAAETAWGRRIEVFQDQRNTGDPAELAQAGDELLTAGGFTSEQTKLTPTDDETMLYGRDWFLGDFITAVIGEDEKSQVVTQAAMSISKDGVLIGAAVGDLDSDDQRALELARRVRRLETRT